MISYIACCNFELLCQSRNEKSPYGLITLKKRTTAVLSVTHTVHAHCLSGENDSLPSSVAPCYAPDPRLVEAQPLHCDSPNGLTQVSDLVYPLWTSVHSLTVDESVRFLNLMWCAARPWEGAEILSNPSEQTTVALLLFLAPPQPSFFLFVFLTSFLLLSCVRHSLCTCVTLHACLPECVWVSGDCVYSVRACVCVHVPVPLSVVEQITQRLGSQMTNQWYTD